MVKVNRDAQHAMEVIHALRLSSDGTPGSTSPFGEVLSNGGYLPGVDASTISLSLTESILIVEEAYNAAKPSIIQSI